MKPSRRPNLAGYFRAKIDHHVNGMMSSSVARLPVDVRSVVGDVTDREITVTMKDNTVWLWSGGQYAARKVNGCYAPLMPRPVS